MRVAVWVPEPWDESSTSYYFRSACGRRTLLFGGHCHLKMRVLLWLALATLAEILTINAWLIIQALRAARRALAVQVSPATILHAHRASGGFGGVWLETHSTQKSMNVRILRDRYLRLT